MIWNQELTVRICSILIWMISEETWWQFCYGERFLDNLLLTFNSTVSSSFPQLHLSQQGTQICQSNDSQWQHLFMEDYAMLIIIVSVLAHFRSVSVIHNCLQEILQDWQCNYREGSAQSHITLMCWIVSFPFEWNENTFKQRWLHWLTNIKTL